MAGVAALLCALLATCVCDNVAGSIVTMKGEGRWRSELSGEDLPRCAKRDVFSFLHSDLRHGKWRFSDTNVRGDMCKREYAVVDEESMCPVVRLSGAQVRQCLAGRHIVMIGDSLTRCVCACCCFPCVSSAEAGWALAPPAMQA